MIIVVMATATAPGYTVSDVITVLLGAVLASRPLADPRLGRCPDEQSGQAQVLSRQELAQVALSRPRGETSRTWCAPSRGPRKCLAG